MKRNRDNILRVYHQATADEIREGLEWYSKANADASSLDTDHRTACGIIAAVSPGLKWSVNVEVARRIINGQSIAGLGRVWPPNQRKAQRILSGESPEVVLHEKKDSGFKVRAFYACLINPANWFDVCIDGHAFGIWSGKRIPLDKIPNITPKRYRRIADDYAIVAESVGLLPNQLQAITWVVWRRLSGIDNL